MHSNTQTQESKTQTQTESILSKKIGILGGTFNPPHLGHLYMAQMARDEFNLDEVLFMPLGDPPHKKGEIVLDKNARAMLSDMIASERSYITLSRIELDRQGFTYTVDTLTELRAQMPYAELYYIIGTDTLFKLEEWKDYKRVFELTEFICIPRPGDDIHAVFDKLAYFKRIYHKNILLGHGMGLDISSTKVREYMRAGKPIDSLVGKKVAHYLTEHGVLQTALPEQKRNEYLGILRKAVDSRRYNHSLGVEKTALELAHRFGVEERTAQTAAIFHDLAKCLTDDQLLTIAQENNLPLNEVTIKEPRLLHGPVSALFMERDYGITDSDILNAVRYHTTGRRNMTRLEMIIYVSDIIEPNRKFDGIEELREMSKKSLSGTTFLGVQREISNLLERGFRIEPNSVEAYNYLLDQRKRVRKDKKD